MEKLAARTKANSYRNKSIVCCLVGVFLFFLSFGNAIFFIFSIISVAIGAYFWKKTETWRIGAEGEEAVTRALQKLDSSFRVFHDIVLPGERQNIDHVVVGPAGTFVIETKNLHGIIRCYEDEWTRKKVGRRGTIYPVNIGNPSKQAKRNAVFLKNWLQSENIDVGYIVAVVVFTNEDAELKLVKPTVKIVHVDDLLGVFNGESNFKMTREKIESVSGKLYQLKNTAL